MQCGNVICAHCVTSTAFAAGASGRGCSPFSGTSATRARSRDGAVDRSCQWRSRSRERRATPSCRAGRMAPSCGGSSSICRRRCVKPSCCANSAECPMAKSPNGRRADWNGSVASRRRSRHDAGGMEGNGQIGTTAADNLRARRRRPPNDAPRHRPAQFCFRCEVSCRFLHACLTKDMAAKACIKAESPPLWPATFDGSVNSVWPSGRRHLRRRHHLRHRRHREGRRDRGSGCSVGGVAMAYKKCFR